MPPRAMPRRAKPRSKTNGRDTTTAKHTLGGRLAVPLAYHELVHHVREMVAHHVPRGATVAVVSKGDPDLIAFADQRGMHVPRNQKGAWAGFHPADDSAAIAALEQARASGAQYFLLPDTYRWWLDHYADFAGYLQQSYQQVTANEAGILYKLSATNGSSVGQLGVRVDFLIGLLSPLLQALQGQAGDESVVTRKTVADLTTSVEGQLAGFEDSLRGQTEIQQSHSEHLQAIAADIESLLARLHSLEDQNGQALPAGLEDSLNEQTEIQKSHSEHLKAISSDIESLTARLAVLDDLIPDIQQRGQSLEDAREEQTEIQKAHSEHLKAISSDIESLTARLAVLDDLVPAVEQRVQSLADQLDEQHQEMEHKLKDQEEFLAAQLERRLEQQHLEHERHLREHHEEMVLLLEDQRRVFESNLAALQDRLAAQEALQRSAVSDEVLSAIDHRLDIAFDSRHSPVVEQIERHLAELTDQQRALEAILITLQERLEAQEQAAAAEREMAESRHAALLEQTGQMHDQLAAASDLAALEHRLESSMDSRHAAVLEQAERGMAALADAVSAQQSAVLGPISQELSAAQAQLAELASEFRVLHGSVQTHQEDTGKSLEALRSVFEAADRIRDRQESKLESLAVDARLARTTDAWLREMLKITTDLAQRVAMQEQRRTT